MLAAEISIHFPLLYAHGGFYNNNKKKKSYDVEFNLLTAFLPLTDL